MSCLSVTPLMCTGSCMLSGQGCFGGRESRVHAVLRPSLSPQVFNQFRIIWADHGDDVSRQYAGTGALKSGFTRTGMLFCIR
jgi:hypothetical protein